MPFQLDIGRGVHLEIAEYWAFLESRHPGLGDRLTSEIFDMLRLLQENPYLFQTRYGHLRIALTRHYRYKTNVRILTIRHPRKHPALWIERL